MAYGESNKKETHTKMWYMVWMAFGKVYGEELLIFIDIGYVLFALWLLSL